MEYIQGSTYEIQWSLFDDKCQQSPIQIDTIDHVDFAIGNIIKNYPTNVTYDNARQVFIVSLSAEETFNLPNGRISRQARITFSDKSVRSTKEEFEYVHNSKFKVCK